MYVDIETFNLMNGVYYFTIITLENYLIINTKTYLVSNIILNNIVQNNMNTICTLNNKKTPISNKCHFNLAAETHKYYISGVEY